MGGSYQLPISFGSIRTAIKKSVIVEAKYATFCFLEKVLRLSDNRDNMNVPIIIRVICITK